MSNFNDDYANRWINSITHDSTKKSYISAWKLYDEFTRLTGKELFDEAWADLQRRPIEKKNIVKQRLNGFSNYLINDTGNNLTKKKGVSPKISTAYVATIRSFYAFYKIPIKYSKSQS